MGFKSLAKSVVLGATPDRLLQVIKKMHYLHSLRSMSENDEIELNVVRRLVNEGDSVIDVGSNTGVFTLFLSKWVGDRGCVYSIEPIPSTYDILLHNVNKLRLKNVKPLNFAVSDRIGRAVMEVPRYSTGGYNYYQSRIIDGSSCHAKQRVFNVQLTTIDSFLSSHDPKIAFIKIDVEGHELQAVRGAARLLERCRPALMIEISGEPDNTLSESHQLLQWLAGSGYTSYWYDGNKLVERRTGDVNINLFFLTEKHLEKHNLNIVAGR